MKFFKTLLRILIITSAVFFAVSFFLIRRAPIQPPRAYGVTFAAFYAEEFGLDWKETYHAVLDDLGVRALRIPVYWNRVEPEQNRFSFDDLDWQVAEAKKRGATIVLVLGRKLPRWPECHEPEWARQLIGAKQSDEFNNKLLHYIQTTIERYRGESAVTMWQIENEPYLPFGDCKNYDSGMVDEEIALVKSLDSARPVMVTDSGELSLWVKAARRSDVFGSTMYRTVHNKIFGTITYPLPPSFFRLKHSITELVVGKKPMIIVELQGEPWSREATPKLTIDDHYETMNPETFQKILRYSSRTGFDTFYLWGVEWWYWLKTTQNDSRMWEIAKEVIAKTQDN